MQVHVMEAKAVAGVLRGRQTLMGISFGLDMISARLPRSLKTKPNLGRTSLRPDMLFLAEVPPSGVFFRERAVLRALCAQDCGLAQLST